MQRIRARSAIGIHATALRNWGVLFILAGIVGKCVLQNQIAGLDHRDLLAVVEGPMWVLLCAIGGILLQMLESCALPIFAFLLVEGFQRTGNWQKYILRIFGTALIAEIPYNLAYGGRLLDISCRNPMFALVLGLVLLKFYSLYPEKDTKSKVMKALLTLAAFLWAFLLGIQYGVPMLVLVAVSWGCREKPRARNVCGAVAALVCSVFSLYMLAAPLGFLLLAFYNDEPVEYNRKAYYLAYPLFLAVVGIIGAFV